MDNYIQKVKTEIEELHQFFTDWFNGKLDESSFARVENVLHQNFDLITPRGEHFRRDEILDLIRNANGADPQRKIWTQFISCKKYDNVAIALYYEMQDQGDNQTKRLSTAVFSIEPNLMWLHVHETWAD